jgi:electron transport complex protein RnfD
MTENVNNEQDEKNRFLLATTSPHIRCKVSVSRIMWAVIFALLLPTIGGIYFFGLNALLVILTTVITAVLTEFIIKKLRKIEFVMDGSAVVTGLLLGLILPPLLPQYLWMAAIGSVVAIGIAKEAFGGLGHNMFNPALVGRAFMSASFSGVLTSFVLPTKWSGADAVTGATPLKESFTHIASMTEYKDLLFGNVGGSIGETSALLILIGGLILILLSVINWRIPLYYIGTVFVFTVVFGGDPYRHILAGGLFLGAFFMATDYVTAPLTDTGKIIFSVGAGILTVCIRNFGGMPEGVCFSILLMNSVTPLIDRYTVPRPFGYVKPEKKDKEDKEEEKTEKKRVKEDGKKDEKKEVQAKDNKKKEPGKPAQNKKKEVDK